MKSILPLVCLLAMAACDKQEAPKHATAPATPSAANRASPLGHPAPAPATADTPPDTTPPAPAPTPASTLQKVDNPEAAAAEMESSLSAMLKEITALAKEVGKSGDRDKLMAKQEDLNALLKQRMAIRHSLPEAQQAEFVKRSTPVVQELLKIFREHMDAAAILGLPSNLPIKKDPESPDDTDKDKDKDAQPK